MMHKRLSDCGTFQSRHWSLLLVLPVLALVSLAASSQGTTFPSAGWDSFPSEAWFRVVLTPAAGGGTYSIRVSDPSTYVLRSSAHVEGSATDTVGAVVGDGTAPAPVVVDPDMASDSAIGLHPSGYESGPPRREVHTKMAWLRLTNAAGWVLRAGDAAPARSSSFGEVESKNATGDTTKDFPARGFFNLFLEIDVPAAMGGMTIINRLPVPVEMDDIKQFPPDSTVYYHTFEIAEGTAIPLYDTTACIFVGWLLKGGHGVNYPNPPADTTTPPKPSLLAPYPTVFSVDGESNPAEGLDSTCAPTPNDVFALGTAGGWGGVPPGIPPLSTTEGELFQGSGGMLGAGPDGTNILRISGALGTGIQPGPPPPYMGPITPPPTPPAPVVVRGPGPFGGPAVGTMGLQEGDNIIGLSFGWDGGNVPLFSVDPAAVGVVPSALNVQAVTAPVIPGPFPPPPSLPENWGGEPGQRSSG